MEIKGVTLFVSPIAFSSRGYGVLANRCGLDPETGRGATAARTRGRPFCCVAPENASAEVPSTSASSTSEPAAAETPTRDDAPKASDASADASLEPPPSTFFQAISQAYDATLAALKEGEKLLEVEFPPLPAAQLESAATGAYDVSDANVRLAVAFARRFVNSGQRVALLFPDIVELERVEFDNSGSSEPIEGLRLGCVKDSRRGAFIERLWTSPPVETAVRSDDDVLVVIGCSCQELPDVERLVEAAGDRPVILFNLKLDSARGDLGLPAFPRRALHMRFLSRVLPVYYLRTRTYSRSIPKAPFIVNYSGALYRVYPGPYQVLLDGSGGRYERLATLEERPPLGGVRDILTDGLRLDGVDGSNSSFMFKGYKSTTWWEDDREKQSSNKWRS